jgi:PDZ domain/Aspartyl protease
MLFSLCLSSVANAQYFDLQGHRKHVTIPFQMIRNLIIIKLDINGKGPFNFILDSGVGLMLITDPKLVDSINLSNKRTIKISGLGEGDAYEAYITSQLKIDIPGLVSYDVGAAILKTDHFGLSNFVGIPIQGLLGYEFFSALAVKIDFRDSTLTVSKPKDAGHFTKGGKIPLRIEDRKAYLQAKVVFPDGVKANEKLVFDLGAVHDISLENIINKQGLPKKSIAANLGVGLTGPINGVVSRLAEVDIGKYKVKNVITSFPDYKEMPKTIVQRDGNLGIGLLKRFIMIVDYPDSVLYIKPGPALNEPFEHDMSGLEYFKTGEDFDHIMISRVEPGSPADEIGLEPGDEIMGINFKSADKMSLEEIDELFKSAPGRKLLLEVYHDKKYDNVVLTLKRRI